MNDLVRNVMAVGMIVGLAGFAAQFRVGRLLVPVLLVVAAGVAVYLQVLGPAFALDSFLHDAPWLAAAILAAWTFHARIGWVRATSWPAVVLLTALFGDVFTAMVLAQAESDQSRRARLVIAASGASLCGRTSGETALILGAGAWPVMALGVALAAVGFVGGGQVRLGGATPRAGLGPAWVALVFGAGVWLLTLVYAGEGLATALEQARLYLPGRDNLAVGAGSILTGMLFQEGGAALFLQSALDRALSLRGDGVRESMLVGLSIGGGLPLLIATGSRLRVGVPLWLVQVAMGLAFLWWRWS